MAYSSFYANFYAWRQRLGAALAAVWRFRPTRRYFLAVGIMQLGAWWQAIFIYRQAASEIIALHYNVDFGINWLAEPRQVFWFPAAGLILTAGNYLLAAAFHRHADFRPTAHLLLTAAAVGNLLLVLALLAVYLINLR